MGSRYSGSGRWSYAPAHRMFYRWSDGAGIEERALPHHTPTGIARRRRATPCSVTSASAGHIVARLSA